jgi:hypothetical protein
MTPLIGVLFSWLSLIAFGAWLAINENHKQ